MKGDLSSKIPQAFYPNSEEFLNWTEYPSETEPDSVLLDTTSDSRFVKV